MKISLITINRNNVQGLRSTLGSIASQSRDGYELEHIVVDGESTDGSVDAILPELRSRVIVSPPHGVYNAINEGLKAATGDIVGLLHSGDTYSHGGVLEAVDEIFSDADVQFAWGDVRIGRRFYSGRNFRPSMLTTGYAPPHPTLFMRRQLLDSVGFYDETYVTAADFEYFVRLFSQTSHKGLYDSRLHIDMSPGGASQKWRNRIKTNNAERLRALRTHGLSASRVRLLAHYKYVLKGYLTKSPQKSNV